MTPRRYLRNLWRHPGLGYATFMTFVGAVAGRRGSTHGVIIGALVGSIFWIPVLVTHLGIIMTKMIMSDLMLYGSVFAIGYVIGVIWRNYVD